MAAEHWFLRVLRGVWGTLDVIVDLIVLAFLFLIGALIIGLQMHRPAVPSSAALVVNPQGDLVEQYSGEPGERALDRLLGRREQAQTQLRDVVTAIQAAAADKRIKALLIAPDKLESAALPDLQAIAAAVADFRHSGKPVLAYASAPDQAQYYLAAQADKVALHPDGSVILTGFGAYNEYFKDAIDKLRIDWNVFRVGKYKSFVEPFTRNDMSPAARKADQALIDALWNSYREDVARTRHLDAKALAQDVAQTPDRLQAMGGDAAKLALEEQLVDRLETRDEVAADLAKTVGSGAGGHGFSGIGFQDYLAATEPARAAAQRGPNQVGIVVAEGDILNGEQPPGAIGGETLSRLIREARHDPRIKALVLRVDSPGGSAFASELIAHEIELTKAAGKPVVVSMGAVAASGGYWISMNGDRIYARPTTITGSIGILGMFPTFQNTLAKLGVHNDGVGTTPLSGDFRLDRPLSPAAKKIFQASIEHGYREFVAKVAAARHLKVDDVEKIAQGRVWSGLDAKRLGLIDAFGGAPAAVKSAAQLAGIANNFSVRYIEPPLSFGQRLLISLSKDSGRAAALLPALNLVAPQARLIKRLKQTVSGIARFNDPRGIYAYCFCSARGL